MAEPDNFVLILLREMRAEMNEKFGGLESQMNVRFDAVDERFDRMEKRIDAVKQAAFGESLMARYTVAEVEDRLAALERRMASLEGSRS